MKELYISPLELKFNPIYKKMELSKSWVYCNLLNSISVIGLEQPIIIDNDLFVIDGNKRLQASLELGVDVIFVKRINPKINSNNVSFLPSELLTILDVFERKYGVSQYSKRTKSDVAIVLRNLIFRNKERLKLYYDLKRLLSYLSDDDLTTYLSKIDSGEISEGYLVKLLQQKRDDEIRLDFKLFSMEDRTCQNLAA